MPIIISFLLFFFFFNDTATTEIYTLSLHDALPIWSPLQWQPEDCWPPSLGSMRSEEHTSELQSQSNLVCRLLLEKKKKKKLTNNKINKNNKQNTTNITKSNN